MRKITVLILALLVSSARGADVEFFEKKIRPILAEHCYSCHSEAAKKKRGDS